MIVSLATVVARFPAALATLDHLLTKGEEHARADNIAPDDILEWRLAPDMFPLRGQVQSVINLAVQWASRAAGVTVPSSIQGETGLAGLRAALADATAFLSTISPDQFAGRDGVLLDLDLGAVKPTMPIGQWITGFATTNLYFHLSIAYAILRSRGVALSKPDLFAGGF